MSWLLEVTQYSVRLLCYRLGYKHMLMQVGMLKAEKILKGDGQVSILKAMIYPQLHRGNSIILVALHCKWEPLALIYCFSENNTAKLS